MLSSFFLYIRYLNIVIISIGNKLDSMKRIYRIGSVSLDLKVVGYEFLLNHLNISP